MHETSQRDAPRGLVLLLVAMAAAPAAAYAPTAQTASALAGGTRSTTKLTLAGASSPCAYTDTLLIPGSNRKLNLQGIYSAANNTITARSGSQASSAIASWSEQLPQTLGNKTVYLFDSSQCLVEVNVVTVCPVGTASVNGDVGDALTLCKPGAISMYSGHNFLGQMLTGVGTQVKEVSPHGAVADYSPLNYLYEAAKLARARAKAVATVNTFNFDSVNPIPDGPPILFQSGPKGENAWSSTAAGYCAKWTFVGGANEHLIMHPKRMHLPGGASVAKPTFKITKNIVDATGTTDGTPVSMTGLSDADVTSSTSTDTYSGFVPVYLTGPTDVHGYNVTLEFCANAGVAAAASTDTQNGVEVQLYAMNKTHTSNDARVWLLNTQVTNGVTPPKAGDTLFDIETGQAASLQKKQVTLLAEGAGGGGSRRLLSSGNKQEENAKNDDDDTTTAACSGYRYVPVVSSTPADFDMNRYFGETNACGVSPRLTDADHAKGKRALLLLSTPTGTCPVAMPNRVRSLLKRDTLYSMQRRFRVSGVSFQMLSTADRDAAVAKVTATVAGQTKEARLASANCRALQKHLVSDDADGSGSQRRLLSTTGSGYSGSSGYSTSPSPSSAGSCGDIVIDQSSQAAFDQSANTCIHSPLDCDTNEDSDTCIPYVEELTCASKLQLEADDYAVYGYYTNAAIISASNECSLGANLTLADLVVSAFDHPVSPCADPVIEAGLLLCKNEAAGRFKVKELEVALEISEESTNVDADTVAMLQRQIQNVNQATDAIQAAIRYEFLGSKVQQSVDATALTGIYDTLEANLDVVAYRKLIVDLPSPLPTTAMTLTSAEWSHCQSAAVAISSARNSVNTQLVEHTHLSEKLTARINHAKMPSKSPFTASGMVVYRACVAESLFDTFNINAVLPEVPLGFTSPECATGGQVWRTYASVDTLAIKGIGRTGDGVAAAAESNTMFAVGPTGRFKLVTAIDVAGPRLPAWRFGDLRDTNFASVISFLPTSLTGKYSTVNYVEGGATQCPKGYNYNGALSAQLLADSTKGVCWNQYQEIASNTSATLRVVSSMTKCSCPAIKPPERGTDNTALVNGLVATGPPAVAQFERMNQVVFYDTASEEYVRVQDVVCSRYSRSPTTRAPNPVAITAAEIRQQSCGSDCAVSKQAYGYAKCCASARL